MLKRSPLLNIRRSTARAVIGVGWAIALLVLGVVWVGPDSIRQDWRAIKDPALPYMVTPLAEPGWVNVPSRLLDVGQDEKSWSVMRMLLAWRHAGLGVDESRALVRSLHEFALPTVIGRESESLASFHQQRWQALEEVVAKTRPDVWKALGGIGPDTPLSLPDDVAAIVSDPSSQDLLEWVALFGEIDLMASRFTGLDEPGEPTLELALDSLARATHEVGLKHLRVPLASWGCAPCLSDIALGLRQANADLAALTGWEGPVLGLDGRVGLTLGVSESAYTDGHPRSGELLEIRSDWQDLPHEWFHALDLVMARHAQPFARLAPLSAHPSHPWRRWVSSAAARQWWKSQRQLLSASSPWLERRRKFSEGFVDPHYWTSPTELLAFAFEHQVRTSPAPDWLGRPPHSGLSLDPDFVLTPTDVEQDKMGPLWAPLLYQAGLSLGLAGD